MGAFEAFLSGEVEATVEYHPAGVLNLTLGCYELTKTYNLNRQKTELEFSKFFAVQKLYRFGYSYQSGDSAWRVV